VVVEQTVNDGALADSDSLTATVQIRSPHLIERHQPRGWDSYSLSLSRVELNEGERLSPTAEVG